MTRKSLVAIGISIFILSLLIYVSGPEKVFGYLIESNPIYLFLGFLLWVSSIIFRTIRWKILLKNVNSQPSFSVAIKALLAGLSISNITPGKAGDPIRAYFLKKTSGDKISIVVSSILIERLLDFFAIVTLSMLFIFYIVESPYFTLFVSGIVIYLTIFFVAIYIMISEKRLLRIIKILFRVFKFIPKIREKSGEIQGFTKALHKSFLKYKDRKSLIKAYFFSICIWIAESSILFLVLLSLGVHAPLLTIISITPMIIIISVLTFLPGGLGSGDALLVIIFSTLIGIPPSQLTAATILGRLVSFWPCILIGSYFATKIKIKEK